MLFVVCLFVRVFGKVIGCAVLCGMDEVRSVDAVMILCGMDEVMNVDAVMILVWNVLCSVPCLVFGYVLCCWGFLNKG